MNLDKLIILAKEKLNKSEILIPAINTNFENLESTNNDTFRLSIDMCYSGKNETFFEVYQSISNLYNVYRIERLKIRTAHPNTKKYENIRGSTKKIRKQKGTGYARKGRIRSPLHKGGVVTFGPNNRSYNFKINKKSYKIALLTALIHKFNSELLLISNFIKIENVTKTKEVNIVLQNIKKLINIDNQKKILIVIDTLQEQCENFIQSCNNIDNVIVCDINKTLNIINLINNYYVIFSRLSFDKFLKNTYEN